MATPSPYTASKAYRRGSYLNMKYDWIPNPKAVPDPRSFSVLEETDIYYVWVKHLLRSHKLVRGETA